MGYGAVVPDGYGVSYNLQNNDVIFCIGSFFSCFETKSINMAEAISSSLKEMQGMLEAEEE